MYWKIDGIVGILDIEGNYASRLNANTFYARRGAAYTGIVKNERRFQWCTLLQKGWRCWHLGDSFTA